MKKEKITVLKREFPFLNEIIEKTKWDYRSGTIRISRMDTEFLEKIPSEGGYSCSAGRSEYYERLFTVRHGKAEEIGIIPKKDYSTGYSYDKAIRTEGQTFLSVLKDEEPFDFLVHEKYSYNGFIDGEDYHVLTILKKSKHLSIREEWDHALARARRKILIEADV